MNFADPINFWNCRKIYKQSLSQKKQLWTLSLPPVNVCSTASDIASTLFFIWYSHVPASFSHRGIDCGDRTTLFYNVRPHLSLSTVWYDFMVSGLFLHDKVYRISTERNYYSRIDIRYRGRHLKLNKYPEVGFGGAKYPFVLCYCACFKCSIVRAMFAWNMWLLRRYEYKCQVIAFWNIFWWIMAY